MNDSHPIEELITRALSQIDGEREATSDLEVPSEYRPNADVIALFVNLVAKLKKDQRFNQKMVTEFETAWFAYTMGVNDHTERLDLLMVQLNAFQGNLGTQYPLSSE